MLKGAWNLVVAVAAGFAGGWGAVRNHPAVQMGYMPDKVVSIMPGRVFSEPEKAAVVSGPRWAEYLMRISAYCPCDKCCDKYGWGYRTASGHRIRKGERLAAGPDWMRFETELMIPGYNDGRPVKVLDRGGAIKGNKLDVYFDTHKEALQWGVQRLKVKVRLPDAADKKLAINFVELRAVNRRLTAERLQSVN